MTCKLYVGNLPFSVTENSLHELFSQFGTVESAKVVTDPISGRSKGFGFVEMSTEEECNLAVQNMNGAELEGRSIKVDLARPKENRPRTGNGGGRPMGGGRGGGHRGGGMRSGGGSSDRRSRW